MPPRSCANPTVATVRTSRGAFANRQVTSAPTPRPTSAPSTRASTTTTNHGHPWLMYSDAAIPAGKPPMAPYEKLMARVTRNVKTRPMASSPLRLP